jgi:hypothetical protein
MTNPAQRLQYVHSLDGPQRLTKSPEKSNTSTYP